MNKLSKIGCSALCGSLAAISAAHAGELTVTGGADMTWISKNHNTTGNPLGIGSNFSMKGSGELDNGWTYDLTIAHTNAGAYSSAAINLDMGSLGKLNFNQGDSGNGISAFDDKMPTAWEEAWGAGLSTGVRLALGSGASQNIQYTTPTVLGTTLTLTYAPQYGAADIADKTTASNNSNDGASYDGTININPSLGTELLSGLNIFAGAATIERTPDDNSADDAYEGVAGVTYDLGPLSIGYQVSGDYTGVDGTEAKDADRAKNNFYKNLAFGVAFNVNDDLSISYGGWEAKKAGHTDSGYDPVSEDKRTIKVRSIQAAYTMGGASFRIADTKADNVSWATSGNVDQSATTISLGLAF